METKKDNRFDLSEDTYDDVNLDFIFDNPQAQADLDIDELNDRDDFLVAEREQTPEQIKAGKLLEHALANLQKIHGVKNNEIN